MDRQIFSITSEEYDRLRAKCQENMFLMKKGMHFHEHPTLDWQTDYYFGRIKDMDTLEWFFTQKIHPFRQGILYEDLVFINESVHGDEWWILRYDPVTGCYDEITHNKLHRLTETGSFRETIDNYQLKKAV